MRKFTVLCLCGLTAASLLAGCSKSNKTEASAPVSTGSQASAPAETAPAKEASVELGTYKGVKVKTLPVEVTDEELDEEIQRILDANPSYEEVDRAAKKGDTVNIDYVGLIDGEAFDGGTDSDHDMELGASGFIEGFDEGIIGAKKGAELSLNLQFPDDYWEQSIAGKPVVFDVTVNAVKVKKDSVLDDEFVKKVSDSKFSTVKEFKEDTRKDMEAEKQKASDNQKQRDALNAVVDNSTFYDLDAAVEEAYNQQLNQTILQASAYQMGLADLAAIYYQTDEDGLKKMIRESAQENVKQRLVMDAVAKKEGITVEDADREKIAEINDSTVDELVAQAGQEELDRVAFRYKVINFIADHAAVEEAPEATSSSAAGQKTER